MENSRYKDKTYIGTGGMALVYKAYDEVLGRHVAIKELAEQLCDNAEVRKMFLDEARKMAQVGHQNVVRVYDVIDGEVPTILMEYMSGGSLASQMGASGLPATTVIPLIEQVVNGLKAVHDAGVIHRDVKPENILEHEGCYKITDFGLAMSGEEDVLPFVTNKYAAPEVLSNPGNIRANSDIYSVGIMAIELLLGSSNFEAAVKEALESDSQELQLSAISGSSQAFWQQWVGGRATLPPLNTLDDAISPEFAAFLARLTARDQSARPQDCATLLQELESIKQVEGLRATAATEYNPKMKRQLDKMKTGQEEAAPVKKKSPLWFRLILGVGVFILVAFGLLLFLAGREGGSQHLEVVTNPPGATVTVNGQALESGATPTAFESNWGDTVVFQLPGADAVEVVLAEDMPGLSATESGLTLQVELPVTTPEEPPVADSAAPPSILNSAEAAQYLQAHLPQAEPLVVSLDGFRPTDKGYSIEVKTPLNYQIHSERPGHLLALHLGSDDVLTLIYPSPRGKAPLLAAAGTVSVGSELDLMTMEPLGMEWMVFVVVEQLPPLPVVRGAQPAGDWGLRFPFGGQDSPGRDMVLWLEKLVQNGTASSAIIPVEVVYRLSDS
jgi:tRNA A-37 threonylcarbamoyl transferase component Bud32